MGDCVLTTPALDILKRTRPDLHLAIVVENRFRAVFEGNPDLDALLPPSLSTLRTFRPDLCLNLHGGSRSTTPDRALRCAFPGGLRAFPLPLDL